MCRSDIHAPLTPPPPTRAPAGGWSDRMDMQIRTSIQSSHRKQQGGTFFETTIQSRLDSLPIVLFGCVFKGRIPQRKSIYSWKGNIVPLRRNHMKNITCLVMGILTLSLLVGSASALWENMTPSMGGSYQDIFKTPNLTPSSWASYEDAFKIPELNPSSWASYDDAFKTPELTNAWSYNNPSAFKLPEVTPSMWSSYEDAFKTPELTNAWSYNNPRAFKIPWE